MGYQNNDIKRFQSKKNQNKGSMEQREQFLLQILHLKFKKAKVYLVFFFIIYLYIIIMIIRLILWKEKYQNNISDMLRGN